MKLNTKFSGTLFLLPTTEPDGTNATDSDVDESQSDAGSGPGSEVVMSDWFFKLMFAMGEWDKPEYKDNTFLSLAIVLFSGTEKVKEVRLKLVKNGTSI